MEIRRKRRQPDCTVRPGQPGRTTIAKLGPDHLRRCVTWSRSTLPQTQELPCKQGHWKPSSAGASLTTECHCSRATGRTYACHPRPSSREPVAFAEKLCWQPSQARCFRAEQFLCNLKPLDAVPTLAGTSYICLPLALRRRLVRGSVCNTPAFRGLSVRIVTYCLRCRKIQLTCSAVCLATVLSQSLQTNLRNEPRSDPDQSLPSYLGR